MHPLASSGSVRERRVTGGRPTPRRPPWPEIEAGVRLSHYRILAPLGAGGMGRVFLAHDEVLGRSVALKLLPDELQSDPEARERLLREARAAAWLAHPNVCAIHAIAEDAGRFFIVMQHVEGEPLAERIRRGALPIAEAVDTAIQIARALAAAHARSLVHRDVKPQNVIVGPGGRVTVLDFGLAKLSAHGDAGASPELTRSGVISGTPPYMSPEQLRGEPLDGRSDLFSLGIVLFEMLTGRRPFEGELTAQLVVAILVQPHPPLRSLLPAAPPELELAVDRALAKQRELRYPSAEELIADLQAATLADSSPSGTTVSSRSVTRVLPAAGRRPRRTRRAIDSVIVLPLAGEASAEDDYLAEGIVEGTIRRLSGLPRLRVMARTTAFRYRDSALDPLAIGAELGVRAVLSGVLVRRGGTLALSLELADVEDGSLVWTERYQGTEAELAELTDRIGEQAALALRPRLTASQRIRLGARHRCAPAAYELYLKGLFQWNRREPAALAAAIALFQQANEADPAFAEPYAGLAEAYVYLGFLEVSAPRDAFPRARAAARRALEFDPTIADSHAALGWMAALHDWDWVEAERELRLAIGLNPSSAIAHHWLGLVLSMRRDFAAASPELDFAFELDPLSPIMATALGLTRCHRGDVEGAIRLYRDAFEANRHFVPLHFYLGVALDAAGRHVEALEQFDEATRLSPQGTIWLSGRGHCLGRMGRQEEARAILAGLLEQRERQYASAWAIALVQLGLGEDGAALDWLDRAGEERAAWLATLAVDSRWDRLRGDPRLGATLARLGLPCA